MDKKYIFANGLPIELKNLQDGQIYIFPNLNEGLIEKNVLISQYISSVSGKLMKRSVVRNRRPAIFVIPTSNQYLWNTIVCKFNSFKGVVYEIADRGSLIEMLYDYYGIEYCDATKLEMGIRYNITPTGEHPERIYSDSFYHDDSIDIEESTEYRPDLFSLDFLTNKQLSDNEIRNRVLSTLFDAEYNKDKYGIEYDLDDILKEFYSEIGKTYRLEIVPENVISKRGVQRINYIDCHIYITDENDDRKELILKQQEKAVYLMFLLHKDGISIYEFPRNVEEIGHKKKYENHLNLYIKIQSKLLGSNYIKDPQLLQSGITPIRAKIKDKISVITPNKKYIEKFAIEGYKEQPCKIEAANDEHRESIIKAFGLDREEYGL